MKRIILTTTIIGLFIFALTIPSTFINAQQTAPGVNQKEKERREAETEIKETKAELSINEKKVTESLNALRKIDDDIVASQKEIETVQGQISRINGNISTLEAGIAAEESDLKGLRDEYLQAVKKIRVARKRNSGLVFLFASKSFNEAGRRMRYMKEFSDWRERRSDEIVGKVNDLALQRGQLVQARSDASLALHREEAAKEKLSRQKTEQESAVNQLRANSEALRGKIARRQAEARKLSNEISALIAEQRAKEEKAKEEKRKKEEERRIAEEKAQAERKAAEEQRLAEERRKAEEKARAEAEAKAKKAAEEKALAEANAKKQQSSSKKEKNSSKTEQASSGKKEQPAAPKQESTNAGNYAEARKRKPRSTSESSATTPSSTQQITTETTTPAGFEGMKGQLPKPVSGSFKIVSAFGVHPISPELPDIMDENLGIDAHVSNGAAACAVYDGEVIKIYDRTNTPGFRNIIVVKHGDYITVYANLETLSVKTGQHVKQGQSLGTVGADFDDPKHGLIHFELWKNQSHLDPAAWIKI